MSVVLIHRVCGNCLWQPQETNAPSTILSILLFESLSVGCPHLDYEEDKDLCVDHRCSYSA